MVAYVLRHSEHFLIDAKDPEWLHIRTFKWWLLPHGLMGACALLLGPMQFSDRLRQRFTKFHRVVGRFYVAGVFVAAPLGFYIQYFEERMGGARSFSAAAATDAILWMLTTGIAFAFILNGKVQQHRQWMTRSFAVAIVFLEVRVVLGVTGLGKVAPSMKLSCGLASPSPCFSPTSSCNGRSFAALARLLPELWPSLECMPRHPSPPATKVCGGRSGARPDRVGSSDICGCAFHFPSWQSVEFIFCTQPLCFRHQIGFTVTPQAGHKEG